MVIGLGRFGSNVAKILFEQGHDVLVIDRDMDMVQSVIDQKIVENAMQLDAIDAVSLRKLELEKFEAVIVAIGGSVEDSLLTAATLKELGVTRIVAKASDVMHGKILEKIGVDQIVYPEAEMGVRVAKQLLGLSFLEEFALNENFSIAEVPLPEAFEAKTLQESNIRSEHQLNILAIRRAGGHFSVSPTPKAALQKGDHILVLGTHNSIEAFRNYGKSD